MAMRMQVSKLDDATILRISGDLDSDANPLLKEHLKELVEAVKVGLLIDMTEVKYINSAVLGTFIQAYRLLSERNIKMKFFGMTRKVKSIFLITKLDGVLEIYDNESEALRDLKRDSVPT
jgi:anti-sigma B factor antagonist